VEIASKLVEAVILGDRLAVFVERDLIECGRFYGQAVQPMRSFGEHGALTLSPARVRLHLTLMTGDSKRGVGAAA